MRHGRIGDRASQVVAGKYFPSSHMFFYIIRWLVQSRTFSVYILQRSLPAFKLATVNR